MSMRSSVAAVAAIVMLGLATAEAASVVALTFEQMTRAAPVVVRGKVIQQQPFTPDGSKRVYTDTEVRITESLKGGVDGTILVRQPGGIAGDVFVEVEGAARFVPDEDVVLFLSPAAKAPGVFIPLALSASKVSLVDKIGTLHAVRRLDGLAFVTTGPTSEQVRPVGGEEALGSADDFLGKVRTWIAGEAR